MKRKDFCFEDIFDGQAGADADIEIESPLSRERMK
jgi:hypothetical protein